jgi:hypothetical protein
LRLLATVPSDRACQCIQQDVLAVIADRSRKIIVLQRRRKAGQDLSDVSRHVILPVRYFSEMMPRRSIRAHRSWNPKPQATSTCRRSAAGEDERLFGDQARVRDF